MPWYDLPLERLREYRTSTQEPDGLDELVGQAPGSRAGAGAAGHVHAARADVYDPFQVFDVEFSGAGGDRVRAWYMRPRDTRRTRRSS